MASRQSIVDSDGHLVESFSEMAPYMDPSIRFLATEPAQRVDLFSKRQGVFPSLDGWHYPYGGRIAEPSAQPVDDDPTWQAASSLRRGSAQDIGTFLDIVDIATTVLYPTEGLSIGNIQLPEYSRMICRAYNDYVADKYTAIDQRLRPAALLPMTNITDAAAELRRASSELGLVAAMLPSTGLPLHLAHEYYWPIYSAADELGCALGIHGGANVGIMRLGTFSSHAGARLLWHPVPLMESLVSFIYHGLFDRYPNLHVAFLEGGASWPLVLYDRMVRDSEFFIGANRRLPEYLGSGQILIGCEGNDSSLPYLISVFGSESFGYSSDYPHEVDVRGAQQQIAETREAPNLRDSDKANILGENAKRFYRLA